MARGGNNKPRINNPITTTQHDNHNLSTSTSTTTTTTTSSSQQSITSTRNDPRVVHSSETGIEDSFNNYGKGSQNFSDSMISSGSGENRSSATATGTRSVVIGNSCSGTIGSFNNYKKGSQDFTGAKVNTGQNSGEVRGASNQDNPSDNRFSRSPSSSRCHVGSRITKIARIFSGENSGNLRGQEHVVHCSGTLDSFNNHGKGFQDFSHANINSGGNSWDI